MRMAGCWLGWMGRGLAAVSLSGSLGLAPSAWAADEETKEVKVAPAALEPGRDGFNLVADRLGSIPFTVHLVAGSAADEPRANLLRELLPATLAQVNAHIGLNRIVLAPATLAASSPLKGRAGVITFEPATLAPGVGGRALPDARGSHGWIYEGTYGGSVAIDRGLLDAPHGRALLPHVLLHELLHVLGLFHFEGTYAGGEQVMRPCGGMFSGTGDPAFQAFVRKGIGDGAEATIAALGPEGWGKFCDEVLVAFAKGAYPAVLGQGDLNGLRHVTRGDRIDPATGAFTPGTTPEAIDAAPADTGRWKTCDRCVIL